MALFAVVTQAENGSTSRQRQVFIYSPGERDGLHIAALTDGQWTDVGQLCASDYAKWGSGKRMYSPSLCRAKDGTWRLVFQVDNTSPCFAAAYSSNLVAWRPQDYPIMASGPCVAPIVKSRDDGRFDIY